MISFRGDGEPDALNRYPAVVRMAPKFSEPKPGLRNCAGVIIAPRLVLTAGHCVCWQHSGSLPEDALEHRVESTSCVEAATVEVFYYELAPGRSPDSISSIASERHDGLVRPHPQLEVRLDAKGEVLSSQADLAVIVLDTPVPAGFRPVPLAMRGVILQEPLVMVGFGYDEEVGLLHDVRLVHTAKVIAALDSKGERYLLEQRGPQVFRGGSGGPGLRESPRGPVLVGISTTGLGHEPTLTTLQGYRGWIQGEITRASTAPVQPPGGQRPPGGGKP